MSSENPSPEESPETATPPAEPEPEEPVEEPVQEPAGETSEDQYEELVEPEKPEKPRKKRRHLGAIVTVIVILVILLLWTVLSPRIMPEQSTTYVNPSSSYATLGSFNETRQSWAATTNWGISVSGPENVTANTTFTILVLISKVSEKSSNFWFRGTAISITNMTLTYTGGGLVAKMSNKTDLGYGKLAAIRASLPHGTYSLSVTGQFLVYVDMRIGFLPVEKINIEPFQLTEEITAN